MRAVDEPITLKTKVCRLVSRRPSVRTERPVVKQFDSQIPNVRDIPSHSSESEQIRILLERQREQILADCQAEIRTHEFQADYDRRSIQKLNEMIESQKGEIHRAQAEERRQQDHQPLHEQLLKQNWDLRDAHEKSLEHTSPHVMSESQTPVQDQRCQSPSEGRFSDNYGADQQRLQISDPHFD